MDDTDENVVVTREQFGSPVVSNNYKSNIQNFIQKTVKSYEKQVAKQIYSIKV